VEYAPQDGHSLPYDPFKSLTIPRPIGWLSTVAADGTANLAPFSQWQNLSWDPPMVMFAANQSVLGGRKDTVRNVEETGWFVWNMATWELREAVSRSSRVLPPEVDEFEYAGLHKEPCTRAPGPRVAESPCHMECRHLQTIRLPGNGEEPTVDIVIGRVEFVRIADEAIMESGKLDVVKLRPIARLGYYDYTSIESVFELLPPEVTPEELVGLEGVSKPPVS
jgi:flavin reductase (DIM6/NTAB) family NADH-FMN oxidoreductase RutF